MNLAFQRLNLFHFVDEIVINRTKRNSRKFKKSVIIIEIVTLSTYYVLKYIIK